VVKSSLGAVNNTLADVEYNERVLKEGIQKITDYMNMLKAETKEKTDISWAKIEIEGHILRANNASSTLQRNLDLLINSAANAQKGVLQPQVTSPKKTNGIIDEKCSAFPKDTILPFPLSKDSTHLLLRVCKMQVYIREGLLGYVIFLPLVNRGTFSIYKLIPIPMPLDKCKFLYIIQESHFYG
jgi:hypothetical protein